MKFKYVFIYTFLFILCGFIFKSVAGGGTAPTLIFKSWKAGQGPSAGPYSSSTSAEALSFITNEETKCKLSVEVVYAANQPTNAYKLNSYEFKIEGKILLPGLSEEELKKHTFTFPHPGKQSVSAGTNRFSYSGEGTLSEHWGPSGGKWTRRKHCENYKKFSHANPQRQPQKGRELEITVKFIGYYGTDPEQPTET